MVWLTEVITVKEWGFIVTLLPNVCRPLLSLCIADKAKEMLLANPGFIPLLVRGAPPWRSLAARN
jgi:hypothetical protein